MEIKGNTLEVLKTTALWIVRNSESLDWPLLPSGPEIAKAGGKATVKSHLDKLIKTGHIVPVGTALSGRGHTYGLTAKGAEVVDAGGFLFDENGQTKA